MMQVVRRVQDGVGVAIGFCDTVTGRPLSTILPKELAPLIQTVTGQGPSKYIQSRGFRPSASHPAPWHVAPPSPPTTDLKAPNPPPEQLRAVMRLLSQSVVVCTAAGPDKIPRAMTMSSFTSLTLQPTPVITFNVATPSRTLDSIAASRGLNIHILSGDSSGAAVADHFTRGNVGGDVFAGLEHVVLEQDADGAAPPLLRGKGVVHVLRCKLLGDEPSRGLIKVRDHMIVVAEVVEMIPGVESNEFGLAYADRKYRQVGGVISNE
ncbi:oxidoreductase, putative [Cordyceps militaris CM01]|uniref:Oxidoreductase, putative n=1 Tax=Cordyceps militaris (strain CM01) TaxID=983644 RepID=G3JNX6_CORMM|nr:oxidoreductase, putative [Cordyceps militaris CM01]EGX89586.1 oxidoreductase, putative [Cordyceps militaris CM01]